jgi:hypothetical protein
MPASRSFIRRRADIDPSTFISGQRRRCNREMGMTFWLEKAEAEPRDSP